MDAPEGATIDAPPYRLADARLDPPPRTPGGPPIWLGTQGMQRGLKIVAQFADGWNHTNAFETFGPKRDALLRHCDAVGRDPAEIEISAQVRLGDGGHAAALADAIRYADAGVQHVIVIFPAPDGPDGLRRVVHEVVEPLRERAG
jgi:alkanesulfonate monooxygenase SsuD/methylene tetrahydromethanopterin reductase-like flavin-dependent oxidoreductase (luciferase family)